MNKTQIFLWMLLILTLSGQTMVHSVDKKIQLATISRFDEISIKLADSRYNPKLKDVIITPTIQIKSIQKDGDWLKLITDSLDLKTTYYLQIKGKEKIQVHPDGVFDAFYSDVPLGCTWNETETTFRVFAPRAKNVELVIFETAEQQNGQAYQMGEIDNGVWEYILDGHHFGSFYAYRVTGPDSPTEMFRDDLLLADPYSKAVATTNEYLHKGRTLILDSDSYDWEGDTPPRFAMEDLVIYECHVRDMTAHPSSGTSKDIAGSYKALIQPGLRGGIDYIKSLGVNAVELLPVQDFGNIEIPYNKEVGGVTNTWNPYARNHWGYMTSYFFAPESYYASEQDLQPGGMCGVDGRQVNEFKDVVKAFHREGIAVILDVVYNHVAQYDQNCFKHIDKKYYFHLNEDQTFCSASGCGNDLNTSRPMVRRMIVESIKHWMTEYHVDGFRFDLAAMIDWETVDMITEEARKINPDVILIAEPWGGGKYEPAEFSRHGWAAWNDQIRNGVKGQNPINGQSFIFGKWFDFNNIETMKRYVMGTLEKDGGLFQEKAHAINYLESHDDHTFGDFVRIGLGSVNPQKPVKDKAANAKLTPRQQKVNKLGALFLFTTQGAVMIHEGQEYARSKVIAETDVPDEHVGYIDHNSYNKDNETNWLNFDHADANKELVDYYRGLILLRHTYGVLRHCDAAAFEFLGSENPMAFGYKINKEKSGAEHDLIVLLNGNSKIPAAFQMPAGEWEMLVNHKTAGVKSIEVVDSDVIMVPATSGIVLRR